MKAYLTAKERNAYLKKLAGAGFDADKPDMISAMDTAGDLFAAVVVSYDGSAENVLGRLEDQRADEYDFVLKQAAEVAGGNLTVAK